MPHKYSGAIPPTQFGGWSLDIFPEGDPSSSPGLLYSATLGMMASEVPNPNGVVAMLARVHRASGLAFDVEHCRNPVGVAAGLYVESAMNTIIDNDSRQTDPVEYAGKRGHNPGGVGELAAVFPRVAEYSNPGLEDRSPSGKMSEL